MKLSNCSRPIARLVLLVMAPLPCIGRADPPVQDRADPGTQARRTERITPAVRVFQEASPAVVNLSTTTIVTVQDSFGLGGLFDEIFDFPTLRRPQRYEAHSVGSGFLIHRDGYVVTNAHVVDRASECKVVFADGTELPATKVAVEPKDDLAILKIDPDRQSKEGKQAGPPFPALKLGRSNDLMPGETVIAIGNPLGYQHTITTGIISALNRELRFSNSVVYSGLIQTDASINPGNSGGPLLNILGELVGINTAIRGDAQNIGFAIPVDRLYDLLPRMLDVERLRRVKLGVHFAGDLAAPVAAGAHLKQVDEGSPASVAGLRDGDLVIGIDGKPTPSFMDAFAVLDTATVGQEFALEVTRDKQKPKTVKLRVEELPKSDGASLMWARFGIRVRELDGAEMHRLGLRQPIALLVEEVDAHSQAARKGVARGDLITRFGSRPVITVEVLGNLLQDVKTGDRVDVGVWRIGDDAIVQVELPLKAR
jgi:serine protease Do